MCGIVGLHLKNAALYPLVLMVVSMSSRGPDSTGAVLHDGDTLGDVKDVRPGEICARHGTAAGGSMAHGRAMAGVAGGNPCLASAVLLATGLDGIDRGLDPGEQVTDDMFAPSLDEVARRGIVHLPKTLDRALEELVADHVLRTALARVPGGDVIDYYAGVKQAEFDAYHAGVSEWEIDRYLTLT
jgi:hypothetical protein